VILVITPISWILLHEPQSDQADASVPYVTRDDDTYITASTDPVVDTTDAPPTAAPSTPPTPGHTPTTPGVTTTPSETPGTPGTVDPTVTPTDQPTARPTGTPTSGTTTAPPPSSETQNPRPTKTPTRTPTADPTTPEPPKDPGDRDGAEQELFSLVNNARQDRGCAPLRNNTGLDHGASDEAEQRAESGQVSATGSSKAAAGGKDMSAKSAFDKLKTESSSTIFNCGLKELGVGRGDYEYCTTQVILCLSKANRVGWVVDFD
jgi:uncharacterized protein YkwD